MIEEKEKPYVIDLLRHGETVAGKCFLGSTDAELSELGWKQMESANLSVNYERVISSPLLRCCEFARRYAEGANIPLTIEPAFREIHFGEWEARVAEELWNEDQSSLSAFWNDPIKNTPPDGESLIVFKQRVMHGFSSLLSDMDENKLLLVCHAGVIKIILSDLLGVDLRDMNKLSIDHASVSRVSMWQQFPQINFINTVPRFV